jgi:hypothetical protein
MTRYVIHNHVPAKRTRDGTKIWELTFLTNGGREVTERITATTEAEAKRRARGMERKGYMFAKIALAGETSGRDTSEGVRAAMERKAKMMAEAKAGEDRMTQALARVKEAQKKLKKRSETPNHGYSAQAEHMVKRARASYSLAQNSLNNGNMYKHGEMMQSAEAAERAAVEAVAAIEGQAGQGQRDFRGVVGRDDEERNRDRMYKDAGITRA